MVINISRDFGAVGVCVAHSGTVLGIMFSAAAASGQEACLKEIYRTCPEVAYLRTVQLIAGGLIITGDDGSER